MHLKVTVPFVLFDHMRSKISLKKKFNINIIDGKAENRLYGIKVAMFKYIQRHKKYKIIIFVFLFGFSFDPKGVF